MRYWRSCVASTSGVSCLTPEVSPLEIYLFGRLVEVTLRVIVRDICENMTAANLAGLVNSTCLE